MQAICEVTARRWRPARVMEKRERDNIHTRSQRPTKATAEHKITTVAEATTATIANAPVSAVTKALSANLPPLLFRPGPSASKSKRKTKIWRSC